MKPAKTPTGIILYERCLQKVIYLNRMPVRRTR